jgi:hypothetical protein
MVMFYPRRNTDPAAAIIPPGLGDRLRATGELVNAICSSQVEGPVADILRLTSSAAAEINDMVPAHTSAVQRALVSAETLVKGLESGAADMNHKVCLSWDWPGSCSSTHALCPPDLVGCLIISRCMSLAHHRTTMRA